MRGNKENQEISVVGRLVSLEALVLLMGVVSLVHGLATVRWLNIVMGAAIVVAAIVLGRKWRRVPPK